MIPKSNYFYIVTQIEYEISRITENPHPKENEFYEYIKNRCYHKLEGFELFKFNDYFDRIIDTYMRTKLHLPRDLYCPQNIIYDHWCNANLDVRSHDKEIKNF